MEVLFVGRYAEAQVLGQKLALSSLRPKLLSWPAGDAEDGPAAGLGLPADASVIDVARAAEARRVGLVILTSDDAINSGIANVLETLRVPCWGPTRVAAHFRWDTEFLSQLGREIGVNFALLTVAYRKQEARAAALACLAAEGRVLLHVQAGAHRPQSFPCRTVDDVERAFYKTMTSLRDDSSVSYTVFSDADGPKCTCVCLVAGGQVTPLGFVANTAGSGLSSPVPWLDAATKKRVMGDLVQPLVGQLSRSGGAYHGFLAIDMVVGKKSLVVNDVLCVPPAQVIGALALADQRDWLALIRQALGLKPLALVA